MLPSDPIIIADLFFCTIFSTRAPLECKESIIHHSFPRWHWHFHA
ncbi:hypothetical protein ymoll0001_39470 [Yersinia mollaretii ATCC 43969]|uniref:Uncharacterized protein n=1 Tax=Yersinia mollaretii (strain ATCC 43969 / DSM 18520 / CIP 103324 / CNY 7263 / WAIP 204) TaxID=349967 RepID=A0ABM9Y4W4_YERMW|nr:hypothetical protein ymoll0001_39470 [Yersinia mollaretii ATCC 43969]